MNAAALALPTPLPSPGALAQPAPPADCVAPTATLLRAACRRGQLEDASAAARKALRGSVPQSPHQALLQALAQAQPALMAAPEAHRLYLLRTEDGSALGLLRLRDDGTVVGAGHAGTTRWQLQDGDLVLCDAFGRPAVRFALCGERGGMRLYLGESLADGAPRLLQEQVCTYSRLRMLDPELIGPFCGLFDAQALVPADLPQRPALLLAAPHCGAQALRQALNRSAAIFIDGELLQPQAIVLAEGALPAASVGALFEVRNKAPAWFARMMMGRSHDRAGRDLTDVPVRGFTLAPMHDSAALDWAIAEPRLRIVLALRSNLLAQFADILADQAGAVDSGAALHFEPERFASFVGLQQDCIARLRQRLMQRDGDTVQVDVSRLNPATLTDLVDFLSDGSAAAPAAGDMATPAPGRVIDRFDNPEAVHRCLSRLGQPGWGEVEGAVADLG